MKHKDFLLGMILTLAFSFVGCQTASHADRGAALGGLLGAATGAAIGNNSGKAGTGALIGGALGAASGALIGGAADVEAARAQAIIEERMGRQMAGAVTAQDAVALTQAGIGDDVIISHILANGVAQPPSVSDVIWLHRQGVREPVISALQQTPPPMAEVRTAVAPPPVIIEEHYFAPPPPWYYHRPPPYHRYPRRSGIGWGVSFGN